MSIGYTTPILLSGDMIASVASIAQQGNPGDTNFAMILNDTQALGTSGDLYRLVWYQNLDATADTFSNGQFWRLESYDQTVDTDGDPTTGDEGWLPVPGMTSLTPKNDIVAGLGAGDDYIVFDLGGGYLLYDTNGGLPGTATTLTYSGAAENGDLNTGNNNGELDFIDSYSAAVCFAAGTLINTPSGPRPVESLHPGDLVSTRDHGTQPVRWISARRLSGSDLAERPNLRPVRIKAGALGPGQPVCDLLVSPQHRLLVRSRIARRMFGTEAVLVPAIRLTRLPGITQVRAAGGVDYYHFMTDQHEVVIAGGAEAETFYPGKQALRTISSAARTELFTLFPMLAQHIPGLSVRSAHPIIEGRNARRLIERHRKHRLDAIAA